MSTNSAKRVRRLPRAERIHAIVTAARQAFAANGFEQSSVASIAAAAGVAEGTIYKFFDGKRDLMTTILRDWYAEMIAENEARLALVSGTRARLRVMIRQHLKVIESDPDLCRLFYAEVRNATDYRGSELFRLNRQVTRLLSTVLEEGVACGDLRADLDTRLVRDVIFGGVEHHVSGFLLGSFPFNADEVCERLTALVYDGIGRPDDRPTEACQAARIEAAIDRLERLVNGEEGTE